MRERYMLTTIPQDRLWYVVYSKPRREEFAQIQLRRKGLEVFFPRLASPHCQSGQSQCIPLFPNYLFVRLQLPEEYNYALWSPGVKTIVSFNGIPAPIDEKIINFLQQKSSPEGVIPGQPHFAIGQEVCINGGPLDGLLGIIQNPPDARGRVGILMQLLNRQIKIDVPVHCVTARWTAQQHSSESSFVATVH
jgi:transcriptional antiterminator RfaH